MAPDFQPFFNGRSSLSACFSHEPPTCSNFECAGSLSSSPGPHERLYCKICTQSTRTYIYIYCLLDLLYIRIHVWLPFYIQYVKYLGLSFLLQADLILVRGSTDYATGRLGRVACIWGWWFMRLSPPAATCHNHGQRAGCGWWTQPWWTAQCHNLCCTQPLVM